MSATTNDLREEAFRATISELNHATTQVSKADTDADAGDDDDGIQETKFQVLPTGHAANRVVVFGTLTNVDIIKKDGNPNVIRAHVCDETGGIDIWPGQYAQNVRSRLKGMTTPEHVMVVGKAGFYKEEDSDEVQFKIEPEELIPVDKPAREEWTCEVVNATLDRIEDYNQGDAPAATIADEQYSVDIDELQAQIEELGGELVDRQQSE